MHDVIKFMNEQHERRGIASAVYLNIWNISDWLDHKHYKFSCRIIDGNACVSSARWYVDEAADPSLLYVRADGELCATILNGENTMTVCECSPELLFNEICSIFDFYNAWESKLNACVFLPDGLQRMVDASFNILKNPIFIYNIAGKVLALTKDCSPDTSPHWADLMHYGFIPDDFMARLKTEIDLSRIFQDKEPTFHASIEGGSGRFIHCSLFLGNNRVGQFVVSQRLNILTMGSKHLVKTLLNAINLFLAVHSEQYLPQENINKLFCELLGGDAACDDQLELVLLNSAWATTDPMMIVTLQENTTTEETVFLDRVKLRLSNGLRFCVAVIFQKRIVLLLNCRRHGGVESIRAMMGDHLNDFWIGSSNQFTHMENIHAHYMQSLTALRYGQLHNRRHVGINDCAIWALFDHIGQTPWLRTLVHPSVRTLLNYDQENGTQLFDTFFMYLLNGGNISTASQQLFIHRNSMRYRMDRISQLIGPDLENPEQQEHLLFSCYMVKYHLG